MTTTTTEKKQITIALSERPPVRIVADDWPVIAEARWFSGEHSFQAFDQRYLKVREHADGRRIVYGFFGDGPGGSRPGRRSLHGGYIIEGGEQFRDAGEGPLGKVPDATATIRAIRRVAGAIGDDGMADEVIADLPAEDYA